MSKPTDTHALLKALQQFAEAAESAQNAVNKVAQEIEASGIAGLSVSLADAAVHAGMATGQAAGYGEEYRALLNHTQDSLKAAGAAIDDAVGRLSSASHIAQVLPARCPALRGQGGDAVLHFAR